jgi:hypothetical protein
MRFALLGIVLVAAYMADRTAYDGRYVNEGAQIAHSFAHQFNYKIKDALGPFGRSR